MSSFSPTRLSPRPTVSLASPSGASRRLVDALSLNLIFAAGQDSLLGIVGGREQRKRPVHFAPNTPQRDLVQAIVEDPEQWQKLQRAMRQRRNCTSMGLTQDLHGLIQDRIHDMEEQDAYLLESSSFDSASCSTGGARSRTSTG